MKMMMAMILSTLTISCASYNTSPQNDHQPCTTPADCPEGMQCLDGACVAYEACSAGSDCLGLPHNPCLGSFRCDDGQCVYECLDVSSCTRDTECILADRECCCTGLPEDYVAVPEASFHDWIGRPECDGVDCGRHTCSRPGDIRPVCRDGQCEVETTQDWYSCSGPDTDCTLVFPDCCSADGLSDYLAINAERLPAWLDHQGCLDVYCDDCGYCPFDQPRICWQSNCIRAACSLNRCEIVDSDPRACSQDTDCVQADGDCCGCESGGIETAVHRDFEHAYLQDLEWTCQAAGGGACYDVDLCSTLVAPFCEYGLCTLGGDGCDCTDDEETPVCDEDFNTYPDACHADCVGRDWWHVGDCLPGEGTGCGMVCGTPCPQGLTCVGGAMECGGPGGSCVKRGSCIEPAHCTYQNLTHDACEGDWTCPEHVCTWVCS